MMMRLIAAVLATLALLASASAKDLTLSAKPSNVVSEETKTLEVTCKGPKLDDKNLVIMMKVDRMDNGTATAIASANVGQDLDPHLADPNVQVSGGLNSKEGGSFLTVKVAEPNVNDTGKYQCRFGYLNMEQLKFTLLEKTVEVTFTEPDEPTPVPVLPSGDCSCDQVWAEVKDLRETLIAENRQLKDQLKSYDDSCRVSFTARIEERAGKKFFNGHALVFDSVLSNKGEAYDVESGVFVAPCAGQYYFSLNLRSVQEGDSGKVGGAIEANGTQIARTEVFTDNLRAHYDMASNSAVVTLAEGAEVKVMIHTNSDGRILGEFYSTFNGFFLSP